MTKAAVNFMATKKPDTKLYGGEERVLGSSLTEALHFMRGALRYEGYPGRADRAAAKHLIMQYDLRCTHQMAHALRYWLANWIEWLSHVISQLVDVSISLCWSRAAALFLDVNSARKRG